ncbi:major facilitator superfamily domain-containing protein [Aspergillus pseudonomiae]|uniref:Major facilitator superfamily domain-containing protein n=1 Tax=Aspergillus pseudonomiae TaxID=1506151 RepID=A0A5N6I485_9EURO|nr:major facilitator superfamily domain-containing protein [Aspergillus pseudonomiae]KAB8261416.1 major facilitator superfamily domain-containing protein [Aspergillus pseudonomiae]KAE8400081.1 major facilitator superfamily domain-containing protein [Aspergillus pseudonomiae]
MATKQPEQPSAAATAEPPNGGLAAWVGVFASFLLFVTPWGFSTAFGAFQSYYQSDLLSSRLMMLSLSPEYYQLFLMQGICCGLGSGLNYVPALSLVSTCFTTRRGLAVGLVTSGASIGGVVFPIIFIRLQPRIGFPWTVRTMGFIQLACSCIAVPLLMATTKTRQAPPRRIIHWHAMTEWHFNAYGIANFFIFTAYFIPIFYVPTFAQTALHTSTTLSFYMVSIMNAGSAIGRIGSSLLTYCLGASHILLVSVIASAVLLFGWTGIHWVASFVGFCVPLGIFSGVLISANPLAIAHPIVSPTPCLGVLVGAPIGGIIEGHRGSDGFLGLQLFSAVGMIVGAVFLLVPTMAVWRYEKP